MMNNQDAGVYEVYFELSSASILFSEQVGSVLLLKTSKRVIILKILGLPTNHP